jgi:hypothetical protein
VTEEEAAQKLLNVINEIEAAGHPVSIESKPEFYSGDIHIGTFTYLPAPVMADGIWTITREDTQ